jgi:hypothetical protein
VVGKLLEVEAGHLREARLQRGETLERRLGPRVFVLRECNRAVFVPDRDQAPVEPPLLLSGRRALLAREPDLIAVAPRPAVERRDQVGRESLRHLRMLGEQVRVVRVEAVGAVARGSAHRLDAAADHQILVACEHAHRGERHGLLPRAAETVQRHAGHRDRPSRVEHRHASDIVRVVARVRAVPTHDVVDVGGFEAHARAQPFEHLCEHALRMQVRECALLLLADPARRSHGIDDPGFSRHLAPPGWRGAGYYATSTRTGVPNSTAVPLATS